MHIFETLDRLPRRGFSLSSQWQEKISQL